MQANDIRESYEKYRASGISLTAIVVTLSAAILYNFHQSSPTSRYPLVFVLPIVLCLVHQLAHFLASLYKAKNDFSFALTVALQKNDATKLGMEKELMSAFKNIIETSIVANELFSFSENVCISAVAIFSCLLLGVTGVLWGKEAGFILGGSSVGILAVCWLSKDAELFPKLFYRKVDARLKGSRPAMGDKN